MKVNVIIPCGGVGSRAKLGYNKLAFSVGTMTLLGKTLSCWTTSEVTKIILAINPQDEDWIRQQIEGLEQNICLCSGGETRTNSVFNALAHIDSDCDFVAIHDGARPFLSQEVIQNALDCCKKNGNACVCISTTDSMRVIDDTTNYPADSQRSIDDLDSYPVDRNNFVCVQTPQIFPPAQLKYAYQQAIINGNIYSDDASIFQQYVGKVFLCNGSSQNKKITTEQDFFSFVPNGFFVGVGWDTHQLVEGRKLVLGGVQIEHSKGLLGHSDADVLTHAIMDAMLSASHNRDIGVQFPDNDNSFKDITSMILLKRVFDLITSQGFSICNISATIMAQSPKLNPHIPSICASICSCLGLDFSQLSILATTTEKLGLIGHEQAVSTNAFCSLKQSGRL